MVGTQARRHMVAEILYYANDYIKMKTLAERLGVSYSTIRNDVDILSLTYNIISKAGFDGGVLLRVQRKKLRFLDADETASLLRIMRIVPESERVYIGVIQMIYRQDHPAWIYVRCASVNAATAFDRLYDLIDEAAGHGFLVRGTSFEHCSGNTLEDRNGLRAMLDAVENNLVEAVIVRDLEQISRNSYLLVGVIEIFRRRDVYLITTECDLNAELINSGLERFVGDRFTRASFGKTRFDVRLPRMDQF